MKDKLSLDELCFIFYKEVEKKFPTGEKITKKAGKRAMDFITEYPLYSSSSNISYQDAIRIALILGYTENELTK